MEKVFLPAAHAHSMMVLRRYTFPWVMLRVCDLEHGTQDFQYAGLDIFNISNVKQRAFGYFILVFYSDWLIIRKFYLNLYKAPKDIPIYKIGLQGKMLRN